MCEAFYDKNLDFSYKLFVEKGQVNFKNLILGALQDEKLRRLQVCLMPWQILS